MILLVLPTPHPQHMHSPPVLTQAMLSKTTNHWLVLIRRPVKHLLLTWHQLYHPLGNGLLLPRQVSPSAASAHRRVPRQQAQLGQVLVGGRQGPLVRQVMRLLQALPVVAQQAEPSRPAKEACLYSSQVPTCWPQPSPDLNWNVACNSMHCSPVSSRHVEGGSDKCLTLHKDVHFAEDCTSECCAASLVDFMLAPHVRKPHYAATSQPQAQHYLFLQQKCFHA